MATELMLSAVGPARVAVTPHHAKPENEVGRVERRRPLGSSQMSLRLASLVSLGSKVATSRRPSGAAVSHLVFSNGNGGAEKVGSTEPSSRRRATPPASMIGRPSGGTSNRLPVVGMKARSRVPLARKRAKPGRD